MPQRLIPFINAHYYHVYNRGVEKRSIFSDERCYERLKNICEYYLYDNPRLKFSKYIQLTNNLKHEYLEGLKSHERIVTVISYVFMPNHFHFLLRQEIDGGVSEYIRRISDSYTKYFNTRYKRVGPLFQGQFKAVHITSDEQLLHVSRYIHLNPYSNGVVSTFHKLMNYQWSSLNEYTSTKQTFTDPQQILLSFQTPHNYITFLKDSADYQRNLHIIKRLLIEQS